MDKLLRKLTELSKVFTNFCKQHLSPGLAKQRNNPTLNKGCETKKKGVRTRGRYVKKLGVSSKPDAKAQALYTVLQCHYIYYSHTIHELGPCVVIHKVQSNNVI